MTAVEWLIEELKNRSIDLSKWNEDLIIQAKEMENRQSKNYAEFAIHCDRQQMKILNFNYFIKL